MSTIQPHSMASADELEHSEEEENEIDISKSYQRPQHESLKSVQSENHSESETEDLRAEELEQLAKHSIIWPRPLCTS